MQVASGIVPTTAGPRATPASTTIPGYVWVIVAVVVIGAIIAVVLVVVILFTRRNKKPKYVVCTYT